MDVERIARAIDPEAWDARADDFVAAYPRSVTAKTRVRSLAAAVRVQELLRERDAEKWDEGYQACWSGAWNGPAVANPYRAALTVAEQPEGRVPE